MKRLKVLSILLILIPGFVVAQQDNVMRFTVQEAQEYALSNNLELKNSKLDIDIADKVVWETTAIGLPQVNGKLDYQHIPGDLPTFDFGMDSTTAMIYDYIFGALNNLNQPMPQDLQNQLNTPGEPMTLGVKNSTTYSVTVSQLVFSGEYLVGLQASKTYLQISKLGHQKKEIDLRADVKSSYISILIVENNLEILQNSIENMSSLVEESSAFAEEGFLESTDVDQLKITLNSMINAKKTIERQIDVLYQFFKIVIGAGLQDEIVLNDDLDLLFDQMLKETSSSEFDIKGNIDYKMMANQVEISELSMKREKMMYLPTVAAFYMYQDKTEKASFDFTMNHIIGVNLSLPIFSSFQRNAKYQQSKLAYQKSLNNQTLFERSLETQAQELKYNYTSAFERYSLSTENVELAKRVFDRTTIKYKEGMVSSFDLTQSNNIYLEAQTDKISALLELFQTKIELDKILNEL